jgi:hypothetical protein
MHGRLWHVVRDVCVGWFEPKEATNLVSPPKCVKWILDEFLYVMPEKLLDELPLRKQVDHVIEVMLRVAPLVNTPYWMSHEELKELKVQLEELLTKGYIKPSKSPMGHMSFLFTRRMGHWRCVWIIDSSIRWQWRIDTHYLLNWQLIWSTLGS